MNKPRPIPNLKECKIQASILLKSIRSDNPELIKKAIKRLRRHPEFSELFAAEIMEIKRKHVLMVIALEQGFSSWNELKAQINLIVGGFLNHWFTSYSEAKAYQESAAGYLFPYKKQFFICSAAYIERLGFNVNDPDWQRIGFDWVKPLDKAAWQRLNNVWSKICGDS